MTLKRKLFACTTLIAVAMFALAATGFADNGIAKNAEPDSTKAAVTFKAPQLKDWQAASIEERSAFLVGVVAMFEAEREWQSPKLRPFEQSSICVWSRGLMGVTFQDMHDAINNYIAAHPDRMDEQVLGVLGKTFVRPVLTSKEADYAAKKYDKK